MFDATSRVFFSFSLHLFGFRGASPSSLPSVADIAQLAACISVRVLAERVRLCNWDHSVVVTLKTFLCLLANC